MMKAAVIGAGIGGLISAAFLSEKGHKVDVYERLPFAGGRFTNIPYKGFQLSTGALHMIPHGKRGPLGKILKEVGAKVEIEDSRPEGEVFCREEILSLRKSEFPLGSRMKFYKWYLMYKIFRKDSSLNEFEEDVDFFTANFLRSFLGWSLSITSADIKFSKFLSIFRNTEKFGGPGIPIGGCKSIIDALVDVIKSNDGSIFLRKKVDSLLTSEKSIKGLRKTDIMISFYPT
jgi:phytoene dehydrogenase-like protein